MPGTVRWFNPTKGYGFIQPDGGDGNDVFVPISAVEKGRWSHTARPVSPPLERISPYRKKQLNCIARTAYATMRRPPVESMLSTSSAGRGGLNR
jgi:CspA family cold shock protein